MILMIAQYNIRPNTANEYATWVQAHIPKVLDAPGIAEIQSFRNVTGTSEVTVLYKFDNLADYATWRADERVETMFSEGWQYIDVGRIELLGPTPHFPDPLRPQ